MPIIETILRQINREIVPQFEEKLRAHLAEQDKEWLIEQDERDRASTLVSRKLMKIQ